MASTRELIGAGIAIITMVTATADLLIPQFRLIMGWKYIVLLPVAVGASVALFGHWWLMPVCILMEIAAVLYLPVLKKEQTKR